MYVGYGDFQFEPWEAGLSVETAFVRSPHTQMKHYQNVVYTIQGELCEEGEYDTNTRLQKIIDAFSTDGKDCGLFHTDGRKTVHFLEDGWVNNMTGNMVIMKQLPITENGEFVTGRQFTLKVGAYLFDPEAEILEHQDTLHRASNAGPHWKWERNRFWAFFPRLLAPFTMQHIQHFGYRVGATTWPLPVSPLYFPPFEANHLREVTHHAPQTYKRGWTGYKTSWKYIYTLPTFDDISRPYRS